MLTEQQAQEAQEHRKELEQGLNKARQAVENAEGDIRTLASTFNEFISRYNAHKAQWANVAAEKVEEWGVEDNRLENALKTFQRREREISIRIEKLKKDAEGWRVGLVKFNYEQSLLKYPEGPIRDQVRKHIEMR